MKRKDSCGRKNDDERNKRRVKKVDITGEGDYLNR